MTRILSTAALAALLVLTGCATVGPDYAREKRLADEIVPTLVVGNAVTLETASGRKFLGIYTPVAKPRAAVILVHGLGVHPDWGIIGELRSRLPERGYTTLSIQMPVMSADADASQYPALFSDAGERLAAALDYLRSHGAGKVAIVSHSMGALMTNDFLKHRPDAPIVAWVPLGISVIEFDSPSALRFPVLDIYAERDLESVRNGAADRAAMLRRIDHGSKQAMIYGTDHFFGKKEGQVASLIDQLLTPLLK